MAELFETSLSFIFTFGILFVFIYLAKRRGVVQHIRVEGPDMHNYKEGTPTMAGLVFVPIAVIIAFIFDKTPQNILLALSTLAFSAVGFLDGVIKILKKRPEGLNPWQKIVLQLAVSTFVYIAVEQLNPHTYTVIPLLGKWDLGWFYPVLAVIFLTGMTNASNLTDGLDGLAGGIYMISAIGLIIFSIAKGLPVTLTFTSLGAILAFLFYNVKPAKVFMGDVGSLALGGYVATLGVLYGYELWIVLLFPIFVVEALSDIIQIGSFKMFKRRVFKMAPIHHHYECKGQSELRVTVSFWIFDLVFVGGMIGVMLCAFH